MTATKQRVTRAEAFGVIEDLFPLLEPACRTLQVAGSIRRGKSEVSDVELVAVPRVVMTPIDLFGQVFDETDLLDDACDQLLSKGTFTQRLDVNGYPRWGKRTKLISYRGVAVDLFSVLPPAQFGVILTIRTGSAKFSRRLMTPRSIGGLLPAHMMVRDGCLYRHMHGAELPVDKDLRRQYPAGWLVEVPAHTEQAFFDAIGLDWIEPEGRDT